MITREAHSSECTSASVQLVLPPHFTGDLCLLLYSVLPITSLIIPPQKMRAKCGESCVMVEIQMFVLTLSNAENISVQNSLQDLVKARIAH